MTILLQLDNKNCYLTDEVVAVECSGEGESANRRGEEEEEVGGEG